MKSSRGSPGSIWTGRPGFDSRQGREDFFYSHRVQSGSEAYSASYPTDIVALWSGVKQPGREAAYSYTSSAEVKNSLR
jgi:hypothetical protein